MFVKLTQCDSIVFQYVFYLALIPFFQVILFLKNKFSYRTLMSWVVGQQNETRLTQVFILHISFLFFFSILSFEVSFVRPWVFFLFSLFFLWCYYRSRVSQVNHDSFRLSSYEYLFYVRKQLTHRHYSVEKKI